PSDDGVIDARDAEDADQPFDAVSGERSVARFLEQIEDRRHTVCGNDAAAAANLDGGPKCRRAVGAGAIEDHVQNDVQIEEEGLHRYLRTTCLRWASAGT